MSHKPKVSICIPSYNNARFLPTALDSALSQSFKDYEIILADDGSTDESLSIAESYAAQYPSIVQVFSHLGRSRRGVVATHNLTIEKSNGVYIAWMGSDDAWYPDKLERQVPLLDEDPSIGLVYGQAQFIDHLGQKCNGIGLAGQKIGKIWGGDLSATHDPLESQIWYNWIPAMTVVIRRECIDKVGAFDESLIYSDLDLWIRVLAHSPVSFVKHPLAMHRYHGHNISVGAKPQIILRDTLAMMSALRKKAPTIGGRLAYQRSQAWIDLQLAYLFFCAGDTTQAAQHLALAIEIDPSLRTDVEYFDRWLPVHRYNLYKQDHTAEDNFNLWAIPRLLPTVEKSLAKELRRRMAREEFDEACQYRQTDPLKVRQMILNCMLNDPRLLIDRGWLSIFTETYVGFTAMSWARELKNRVSQNFVSQRGSGLSG